MYIHVTYEVTTYVDQLRYTYGQTNERSLTLVRKPNISINPSKLNIESPQI